MREFCRQQRTALETYKLELNACKNDKKLLQPVYDKLRELDHILRQAIKSAGSQEILAIKAELLRLEGMKNNFFASSKGKLANIRQAIVMVPVTERNNIINGKSDSCQAVQKALGEHRNAISALLKLPKDAVSLGNIKKAAQKANAEPDIGADPTRRGR